MRLLSRLSHLPPWHRPPLRSIPGATWSGRASVRRTYFAKQSMQVSNLMLDKQTRIRIILCLIGDCVAPLAMTLLLVACLPLGAPLPTETPVPTDTPIPTPTIVWFPPSATPTLLAFPTYTATPEMSPGLGSETLSDDFSY